MHIKTYAIELDKRQRAMIKLDVPCDDALKVITNVDNMHKSGIFKKRELLKWENDASLQGWTATQEFFDTIWTDRAAFNVRLEGAHPYESAMAITATANKKEDVEEAMYLLHALERENAALKDELDATTIASTDLAPSDAPPPKFITAATTTGLDDALIAALTAQSATQAAQITKLHTALTTGGGDDGQRDGGKTRGDGGRGDGTPNPKHKYCRNYKRVVAHEASTCYQLEINAATRPAWWKQEVHGIS